MKIKENGTCLTPCPFDKLDPEGEVCYVGGYGCEEQCPFFVKDNEDHIVCNYNNKEYLEEKIKYYRDLKKQIRR